MTIFGKRKTQPCNRAEEIYSMRVSPFDYADALSDAFMRSNAWQAEMTVDAYANPELVKVWIGQAPCRLQPCD